MGDNTNSPQLNALRGMAATPYQGAAPGGGTAQGVAQLVAALMARKKAQQLGIPVYGAQGAQPGAVTPGAVSSGVPGPAQAPQSPMNPGLPDQ